MRAPKRGQTRSGAGTIRCTVERGHSFLSQFGRVVRHFDRNHRLYLGWVELAACIIFIRAGFFGSSYAGAVFFLGRLHGDRVVGGTDGGRDRRIGVRILPLTRRDPRLAPGALIWARMLGEL